MAQAAESNTIIIQTNFRLLYFAMENIKDSEQHDINYWNRLQTIMYAEIDKNAMYNKEFLKRNMTQMMMFYCKEVKDINRDFYDEVCRPIYNIVKENADDNDPMAYYAESFGKLNELYRKVDGYSYYTKSILAATDLLEQLKWVEQLTNNYKYKKGGSPNGEGEIISNN